MSDHLTALLDEAGDLLKEKLKQARDELAADNKATVDCLNQMKANLAGSLRNASEAWEANQAEIRAMSDRGDAILEKLRADIEAAMKDIDDIKSIRIPLAPSIAGLSAPKPIDRPTPVSSPETKAS